MSGGDIIALPGHPGKYGRRALVEAWQAAGSPPANSAGRLKAEQQYFYDGWRAGLPGFNPADNPNDESQRLAHVRFAALDIDPTPDRIRRLEAAGLIRPYKYEPWHWELPNVRQYPIVRSLPAAAGNQSEEDDMFTDDDRNKLHAAYAALFGPANVNVETMTWKNPEGQRVAYYGVLDILIYNQTLIKAQSAALQALATSQGADPSAIAALVDKAVREAMGDITFSAAVRE
ncbi:hypothetical protein MRBLWO14_000284 [Microbacterium sp. LWO14-1.2]|uniref:hypothetical protein n=1 Tax=Microbacterium sp. LWO14-1.2 TaxID=3135263 RepID=UPI00313A279F